MSDEQAVENSRCPLRGSPDPFCGKERCEWWNERFGRCSVYVIGDRIDDLAIAMEKEVETDDK